MAGYDYDKALRVLRWPVNEVLIAFVSVARDKDRLEYSRLSLRWAALAPHFAKPAPAEPRPPKFANVNPHMTRKVRFDAG